MDGLFKKCLLTSHRNKTLKLFLMGIESGLIDKTTKSSSNAPASKHGSLLSVIIAEAINEWKIDALAEIDVISEAENIALFRRADGFESIARRVARDFELPFVYCEPLPQIRIDDLDRYAVNEIKDEELNWFERLDSMREESILFILSRFQFESLVKFAKKNAVPVQGVMADFGKEDVDPKIFGCWLSLES